MEDIYKSIYAARERMTRESDVTELKPRDMEAKIEKASGMETYRDSFRDYHGPKGNAEYNPTSRK